MPVAHAAYSLWRPDAIEEDVLVCLQVKQKDLFNCYYHTISPTTPGNYNLLLRLATAYELRGPFAKR